MTKNLKESGVKWIGEVPTDWKNKKISRIFHVIGSGTTPKSSNSSYYDGDINWLNTGDLNDSYIEDTKKKITKLGRESTPSLKTYPENSLVMAMYGATIGKLGITKVPVTTNQACCVMSLPKEDDIKFIYYWLLGNRKEIVALGYGGTQPNISQETIKNIVIPLPDIYEQRRISGFLDQKVSQIDSIIQKTKLSIVELKKYKRALIAQIITKGLTPDIKKKATKVEWIGEIPEHWKCVNLKTIMYKKKELCPRYEGQNILSLTLNGVIVRDLENPKGKMPATFDGYQIVQKDNLLLCLFDIDVTPRCVGLIKDDGLTSPAYSQYILREKNSPRFYEYFLTYLDDNKILLHLTKSLRNTLTDSDFGVVKTIQPPLSEQNEIVEYLDRKCAHIDTLLQQKKQLLVELESYKKSLIYEYVAGKKEVL